MRKCTSCGQPDGIVDFRGPYRRKCRQCEADDQRERRAQAALRVSSPPADGFSESDFEITEDIPPGVIPSRVMPSCGTKRTLILGDVHFPYHHIGAVRWAVKFAEQFAPDRIIQVGDLTDQFAFSKFPKLVKQDPGSELKDAKILANFMWQNLRTAAPNAECYQLCGNHDDRAMKRALERAPELTELVGASLRELFTFEGVKTVHDSHEELVLDGISYQHGHRSKLGDHARFNQRSTVCGHSHTGGVVFMRNAAGVFYELNAGFLGLVESEAFAYHSQRKIHTCTLGIGVIDAHGPRFIPYPGE